MAKNFGNKVKNLRHKKGVTREELCGDETELSIRQLARIESGQSSPSILKVKYIAQQLGVSVGSLTDGENLELPKRYKELKYLILRTPTFMNEEKLQLREEQFDEIFEDYYEKLPEEEQLIIECLQASLDVVLSGNTNFATGILNDYFEQLKRKKIYSLNDLILIDLYLICLRTSKFNKDIYDDDVYNSLLMTTLKQADNLDVDELFTLNQVLVTFFSTSLSLKKETHLEQILSLGQQTMLKIKDFHRLPVFNLMEWKYSLFYLKDSERAKQCYEKAILYAQMTGDTHLEGKLTEEWKNDTT